MLQNLLPTVSGETLGQLGGLGTVWGCVMAQVVSGETDISEDVTGLLAALARNLQVSDLQVHVHRMLYHNL